MRRITWRLGATMSDCACGISAARGDRSRRHASMPGEECGGYDGIRSAEICCSRRACMQDSRFFLRRAVSLCANIHGTNRSRTALIGSLHLGDRTRCLLLPVPSMTELYTCGRSDSCDGIVSIQRDWRRVDELRACVRACLLLLL